MLTRIWRWISNLFGGLFGTNKSSSHSRLSKATGSEPQLSDTDYEFLFHQLLDGVAHGWNQPRIVKFFEQLGDRGNPDGWVAWLERFRARLVASQSPHDELAKRMLSLGQQTYLNPRIGEIGGFIYTIGEQILLKHRVTTEIWEYTGDDLAAPVLSQNVSPLDSSTNNNHGVSIEELYEALQQDPSLVVEISEQMGINTGDPEVLINELLHKLNSLQSLEEPSNAPKHELELFNLGLEKAHTGDLSGAITAWEQLLTVNPNISQAWHNRGTALSSLGQLQEALLSFERALQLQPEDYLSWNDRGNILYNLQRWLDALHSWDKVVELRPDYYQAWYNRGCALENLGEFQQALSSYDKVLSVKPDFLLAQSRRNNIDKNL